jgi:hypothetical protein
MEPRTRNAVIVRGAGERVRVEATQGVEGLAILVIIALRPIRIQSLRMTPHNISTVLRIKIAARALQAIKKPFPGTTSFVRLNVQTITIAPMRMRNNEPMLSAPRMQRAVRARRRLRKSLMETIFFAEERAGVRGVVPTLALMRTQDLITQLMGRRTRNAVVARRVGQRIRVEATHCVEERAGVRGVVPTLAMMRTQY